MRRAGNWLMLGLLAGCGPPGQDDDELGDLDGDGFVGPGDCDEGNPEVNVGHVELCDGVDNDCDGLVDEEDQDVDTERGDEWFVDEDGDGWGAGAPIAACELPASAVTRGGDCNDDEITACPGNAEICPDGLDNDCDGFIDNLCFYDAFWSGSDPTHYAGPPLALAGDVDDDGLGDWVIAGGYDLGALHVVLGRDTHQGGYLLPHGAVTVSGPPGEAVGSTVSAAPSDISGDGVHDLVFGTFGPASSFAPGAVYVVFGGASFGPTTTDQADIVVHGTDYDGAGAVSAGGDVDGDGWTDLVIGGPYGEGDTGEVWLVSGVELVADQTLGADHPSIVGETINDWFGSSVVAAPDLDGDGVDDLIVGAPQYDNRRGILYVFTDAWTGTMHASDAVGRIVPGAREAWLGASLSVSVADVDGDGLVDVLTGDSTLDPTGAALLFSHVGDGGAQASSDAVLTVLGESADDAIAIGAPQPIDADGDGALDLVVGAHFADGWVADTGAVGLFLDVGPMMVGSTVAFVDADLRLEGAPGSEFGSVSLAVPGAPGEPDDLIVAAPALSDDTRRSYIYRVPGHSLFP